MRISHDQKSILRTNGRNRQNKRSDQVDQSFLQPSCGRYSSPPRIIHDTLNQRGETTQSPIPRWSIRDNRESVRPLTARLKSATIAAIKDADRQPDRQTVRQTDRQTDRQTRSSSDGNAGAPVSAAPIRNDEPTLPRRLRSPPNSTSRPIKRSCAKDTFPSKGPELLNLEGSNSETRSTVFTNRSGSATRTSHLCMPFAPRGSALRYSPCISRFDGCFEEYDFLENVCIQSTGVVAVCFLLGQCCGDIRRSIFKISCATLTELLADAMLPATPPSAPPTVFPLPGTHAQ